MKLVFLLLAACLTIPAALLPAQPEPTALTSATPAAAASLGPAEATRAWLDTVPAEKRAKSDAYFEGGYWLILWNFLLGRGDLDFSARQRSLGEDARLRRAH